MIGFCYKEEETAYALVQSCNLKQHSKPIQKLVGNTHAILIVRFIVKRLNSPFPNRLSFWDNR